MKIYLVLIKLDFYFITCFVIQYDLIDVHFKEPEFGLTLALLPASLLMMILAVWFVRREWKIAMVLVVVSQSHPPWRPSSMLMLLANSSATLQSFPI